jgi:hypothetical protein
METIGILYNDCYGGFKFSKQFENELERRLGQTLGYRHEKYRDNPEAIKLFLEKGSKWSSEICANIVLDKIPKSMEGYWCIGEYDGKEYVDINIHRAIADATDTYLENPTAESLEWLKETVHKIKFRK